MKTDIIKICHRGIGLFGTNRPIGPVWHPFILDWDNVFHELTNDKGIIKIICGNIDNMSIVTQYCYKRKVRMTRYKERFVDVDLFYKAIDDFKLIYEGQKFNMFDFRRNCIGFKNFLMKRSIIN